MEIAYPDPTKEKKDLSPTDFIVTEFTMGTSSESLQREDLSAVDALCKKLQEAKEEKRILKGTKQTSSPRFVENGQCTSMIAAEPTKDLSQDKINEYTKIGEQGADMSS
ncbi:hypothetical protein KI387_007846 [Taxus chinensis]|uniref:Uncharacterized protein n=1 Tax=Taxus chinensis TaxID=29808 RepID=A0AA38GSN9_TAXCH|nr:hypothetical protein KI387_007846 [Taxus chinensis]